ncbi:hypothetical protein Tco_0886454, partial [Tanacetum coccineum]
SDEELARKVQEEWEAEEERNRIAEENAAIQNVKIEEKEGDSEILDRNIRFKEWDDQSVLELNTTIDQLNILKSINLKMWVDLDDVDSTRRGTDFTDEDD